MTTARRKFSQEFRDELCREVISTSKPIRGVAEAYGIGTETLRHWLIKYRDANGGTETELTIPERARLKELEREVQELKAEEPVRHIMRDEGLVACQPRPFRSTTDADVEALSIPDLVKRDFTADRPGVKFVGDITFTHGRASFMWPP